MVDIPEVKLQYDSTPSIQPQANLTVPTSTNLVNDQISKSLGEASDYFHKQMETASDEEATKAYNSYRDEFNAGFNVGYGDGDLGLKNIEGYDSFKDAKEKFVDRLNKKRDELINQKDYSDYTREVIRRKLDEATSTFHYYMDTQEGQVKTLDAVRNQQVQRESKAQDLSALMTLYNGSPQANQLLQNRISDLETSAKKFYYGRGLATREEVVGKDGNVQFVYKLSPPAQFEMQKNMSQDVSNSIMTLAATNPKAAKAAMQQFGQYVLPNVQIKINKAIEEKDKQDTAYGMAYNVVVQGDAKPELIKQVEDNYLKKNDIEGLKEFRTQVSRIRTEQVKSEKDISADALALVRKQFYAMTPDEAAKISDFRSALGKSEWSIAYSSMTKSDQDAMARMFNNTQTLSFDALTQVQQDLVAGNVDRATFAEHVAQLPVKYRKPYYDAYNGFNISNYKGNAGKDAAEGWAEIEKRAKKDNSIFDPSDEAEYSKAKDRWFAERNSTKQVYPANSDEGIKQRNDFIQSLRNENRGWFGSLSNSLFGDSDNKTVDTGPKFGETNPIGNKSAPLSDTERKKIDALVQSGMSVPNAVKKVRAERYK